MNIKHEWSRSLAYLNPSKVPAQPAVEYFEGKRLELFAGWGCDDGQMGSRFDIAGRIFCSAEKLGHAAVNFNLPLSVIAAQGCSRPTVHGDARDLTIIRCGTADKESVTAASNVRNDRCRRQVVDWLQQFRKRDACHMSRARFIAG
jgi:hypothetical protein